MNNERETYFQTQKSASFEIENLKFEYNYFLEYAMIWH